MRAAVPLLLALFAPGLFGCLPSPHRVPPPELPAGVAAVDQRAAIRCHGAPERLACEATSRATTVAHGLRTRRHRWVSRPTDDWDFGLPPPVARHWAMAKAYGHAACRYDDDGCWHRARVVLVPPDARAVGFVPLLVGVEAPDGYRTSYTRRRKDGETLGIDVSLRSPPATFSPGGPFFVLGRRFATEPKLVGRLGWEIFAPAFVGHALSVETLTSGETTLAYVAQAMTEQWLIVPSLGLGLGLPVQVAPDLATGLRLQASLAFPYVGLVTWLDLFGDQPDPLRGYLGLQLGL